MDQIKAIIFDVGGVLIDLNMEMCKKAFGAIVGYKYTDEMLDPSHGKGLYMSIEEGRISADEFRAAILKDSYPTSTEMMVDEAMWAILDKIQPEKVTLIKELAKRYDLYLLSNNNPISWPKCKAIIEQAGLPVDTTFKRSFISYQMKMLKPNPAIFYEIISELSQYKPSEMLFIDDSIRNTDIAATTGLATLHFPQGDDLNKRLAEIL